MNKIINLKNEFGLTGESKIDNDAILSAGICDTCSIPEIMNTGDGINEPPDPILYCKKMKREICPEPIDDRMINCEFYARR